MLHTLATIGLLGAAACDPAASPVDGIGAPAVGQDGAPTTPADEQADPAPSLSLVTSSFEYTGIVRFDVSGAQPGAVVGIGWGQGESEVLVALDDTIEAPFGGLLVTGTADEDGEWSGEWRLAPDVMPGERYALRAGALQDGDTRLSNIVADEILHSETPTCGAVAVPGAVDDLVVGDEYRVCVAPPGDGICLAIADFDGTLAQELLADQLGEAPPEDIAVEGSCYEGSIADACCYNVVYGAADDVGED